MSESSPDGKWLTISPLSAGDAEYLGKLRSWLVGHYGDAGRYSTLEGKLSLIQAILDNAWIEVGETEKLWALGVGLGDAIAEDLMLEWVSYSDEAGQTIGVNWPGTEIMAFPLTMFSKRFGQGQEIAVRELFDGLRQALTDLAFSGRSI